MLNRDDVEIDTTCGKYIYVIVVSGGLDVDGELLSGGQAVFGVGHLVVTNVDRLCSGVRVERANDELDRDRVRVKVAVFLKREFAYGKSFIHYHIYMIVFLCLVLHLHLPTLAKGPKSKYPDSVVYSPVRSVYSAVIRSGVRHGKPSPILTTRKLHKLSPADIAVFTTK